MKEVINDCADAFKTIEIRFGTFRLNTLYGTLMMHYRNRVRSRSNAYASAINVCGFFVPASHSIEERHEHELHVGDVTKATFPQRYFYGKGRNGRLN